MNPTRKIDAPKYSEQDIRECIEFLEGLADNDVELAHLTKEQRVALMKAAGRISRPDRDQIRKRHKDRARLKAQNIDAHERKVRAATGIRSARQVNVFTAPKQLGADEIQRTQEAFKELQLIRGRGCYVCKERFTQVHFFYDSMCPKCAELNYSKRFQTADLTGQVALITGSRLKIGYQSSLMMLRAGATVIATTRFPVDSAQRYAREEDFEKWRGRLHVYGLDLRHTPSVELFCDFVRRRYDRLDILINNAAQTVRRPPGFYRHLLAGESTPYDQLPEAVREVLRPFEECKAQLGLTGAPQSHATGVSKAARELAWNGTASGIGIADSAKLSQIPYTHDNSLPAEKVFPQGQLDVDLQQVDLRATNSWRLAIGEVPTAEMIELQLVNSIAPFVLCNELIPMMKRDNTGRKHVVNVSAMEGKFHRYTKTDKHPHTNMAKAALNMLTHTSAKGLEEFGIFMNAVDTGWVTDEDPAALSQRKRESHDFQPPLDIVDGAARVCDPFFDGILTGRHWCGKFLKDYFPVDW